METLKLEHIAPYLPYGLLGKSITGNIFILDIASGTGGKGYTKRTIETFITDEYKLLFHPLSSLTKPIQHNGEEFYVIDKIVHPSNIEMLGGYKEIHDTWVKNGVITHALTLGAWNTLFEHHFNVFNLPSHLWIDVNTLDENPYK